MWGKVLNRLQSKYILCKLAICKHVEILLVIPIREKVISCSVYLLSTDEMRDFDGNYVSDCKHQAYITFTVTEYHSIGFSIVRGYFEITKIYL